MRRAPLLLALLALLLLPLGRARAGDPAPAALLPMRVRVESDGFWRVSADVLRARGYTDGQHLVATRRGRPLLMSSSRVGDGIEFVLEPDQGPETRPAVVVLRIGAAVKRAASPGPEDLEKAWAASPVGPRLRRTRYGAHVFGDVAAAEHAIYARPEILAEASEPPTPTWFLAQLPPRGSLAVEADRAILAGSTQIMRVVVTPTVLGGFRLAARQAGRDLGERVLNTFSDMYAGTGTFEWELPDADPAQRVVLHDLTPPSAPSRNDVSEGRGTFWIHAIVWEGPVQSVPPVGVCSWETAAREPWSSLRVPDVARPLRLVRRSPEGEVLPVPYVRRDPTAQDRLQVWDGDARPESTVYASVEVRDAEPLPDATVASSPLPIAHGAEHVIVATQATLAGAQRLAAFRTGTGLPSVAVAAKDLYEAFADGEQDPQAIRGFLRTLREESGGRTPKYVVLVGDAVRDRTDKADFETIPALMARTQYNGATPADALYVEADDAHGVGAPVVGRLPFRDGATMERFVDRLIAYETSPPHDRSRRTIRFLANEARFGPQADAMIEGFFRRIVTTAIPPAYDVEVTFASPSSAYFWPPREFNTKVLDALNAGGLFFTYVGHGFAQGFDSLHVGNERYPVLHLKDVPRVKVQGTPPVVFAIACTTAEFDAPDRSGLGEALLAQPHGPIAYYGATRICHPAANAFLGRSLARALFRDEGTTRRLGDVLATARDEVLDAKRDQTPETFAMTFATMQMLPKGTGVTIQRLQREAFWLYNLLGDPGMRLPLPEPIPGLEARYDAGSIEVEASGLPAGARVTFTVEVSRARANPLRPLTQGLAPSNPANAAAIRANHAAANDKVVLAADVVVEGDRARARLTPKAGERPLDDPAFGGVFFVKAWVEAKDRLLLGAREVRLPTVDSPDGEGR